MRKKVFICTNNKQILGARLAAFAIQRHLSGAPIEVQILNVDELSLFAQFVGKRYQRGDEWITYTADDLQSFTLTRFMSPELMGYEGRALVIDPDIFAIAYISPLFDIDMQGKAIACCSKRGAWDSSVMLLECSALKHWNSQSLLAGLTDGRLDYTRVMQLKDEASILEIPRMWNSLDEMASDTKMLHTTERLTQPWRTGLPIDFTRKKMKKIFWIIPREPLYKILGRYQTTYQPHPDKRVEAFFFALLRDALRESAVSETFLKEEVALGHVRPDIFDRLKEAAV